MKKFLLGFAVLFLVQASAQARPIEIYSQNDFNRILETSPVPVLVEYYASWCAACVYQAADIDLLSKANPTSLKIIKVNIERPDPRSHGEIGERRDVALPVIALYSGNRLYDSMTGRTKSSDELADWIASALQR